VAPLDIAQFELRNYRTIAELVTQYHIDCEFQQMRDGTCYSFNSESEFAEAQKLVQSLRSSGSDLAQYITVVKDKASLERLLVPNAVGAITQNIAAKFWPYKLVAWILEGLVKNSRLNLQTKTPVLSLKPSDGESNKWAVCTSRGTIEAAHVVLATNAYTSHLLPEFADLIVPIRGEMSALTPPTSLRENPLTHSYVFLGGGGQGYIQDGYLIQRPVDPDGSSGGQLMFGGARSYANNMGVGVDDDSEIDELSAERLRTLFLKHLTPASNGDDAAPPPPLKAENEWSGIMGFSRDGCPWVGEVPGRKGVYLSGGYTGHGSFTVSFCAPPPLPSEPPSLNTRPVLINLLVTKSTGMPNAALCAQFTAQLVLARHEHSKNSEVKQQPGEQQATIPAGYVISEARIRRAREMEWNTEIFEPGRSRWTRD
jgi:glycine/D-amino acid oxidase-like deaminating enzyme